MEITLKGMPWRQRRSTGTSIAAMYLLGVGWDRKKPFKCHGIKYFKMESSQITILATEEHASFLQGLKNRHCSLLEVMLPSTLIFTKPSQKLWVTSKAV